MFVWELENHGTPLSYIALLGVEIDSSGEVGDWQKIILLCCVIRESVTGMSRNCAMLSARTIVEQAKSCPIQTHLAVLITGGIK